MGKESNRPSCVEKKEKKNAIRKLRRQSINQITNLVCNVKARECLSESERPLVKVRRVSLMLHQIVADANFCLVFLLLLARRFGSTKKNARSRAGVNAADVTATEPVSEEDAPPNEHSAKDT